MWKITKRSIYLMKKIIAIVAVVVAISGVTLGAAGNNPNPFGIYLAGGYGNGVITLGGEWNFSEDLYGYAEVYVNDFSDPFSIGGLGGVDYEFINQKFSSLEELSWYIRGGGAIGTTYVNPKGELLKSHATFHGFATGVAGLEYAIGDGAIFGHLRPKLGIGSRKNDEKNKTDIVFDWGVSAAFGYRF